MTPEELAQRIGYNLTSWQRRLMRADPAQRREAYFRHGDTTFIDRREPGRGTEPQVHEYRFTRYAGHYAVELLVVKKLERDYILDALAGTRFRIVGGHYSWREVRLLEDQPPLHVLDVVLYYLA